MKPHSHRGLICSLGRISWETGGATWIIWMS